MSESKQTVVDDKTDDKAKPSSEVKDDARDNGDDLEKLLAEYDGNETKSIESKDDDKSDKDSNNNEQKPAPFELSAAVQALLERDRKRDREEQQRQFEVDMKETVKAVRGDLSADVASDRLVRAWIDGMAEENPRLANAWVNRKKDPKAFNRIVEGLAREFAKEFSKRPDPNVTEDRESVSAAVRGASTKTPEDKPKNYGSMSDNDFAAEVEKNYGFRPF